MTKGSKGSEKSKESKGTKASKRSKLTKGSKGSKGSNDTIHLRVTKYAFYILIYVHFLFLLLQKMRKQKNTTVPF